MASTELITIQTFRELSEATLAKGLLDAAGIESFLADDNTGCQSSRLKLRIPRPSCRI